MKNALLDKIKAGASIGPKIIVWPGLEVSVGVRVLTEQDYLDAGIAADQLFSQAKVSITSANIRDYEHEKTTQLLYRAIVDPDTGERVAPNITQFRKLLTDASRRILVQECTQYQEECSPDPDTMSQDELDALMLRLKKNAAETALDVTSIYFARKLITILADRLWSSPEDSGSGL